MKITFCLSKWEIMVRAIASELMGCLPKSLFLSAILLGVISTEAIAMDQCRDVLSDALLNKNNRIASSSSKESDRLFYCSSQLSEARSYYEKQDKEQSGGGGSGSISYGPFSASGGSNQSDTQSSSLTEEKYNLWKSSNCKSEERQRASQSFEYLAQQSVAESAILAWRTCMVNREDLGCWAEPKGENLALFKINWRRLGQSKPKISMSYLTGGTSLWDQAPEGKLLPTDHQLLAGLTTVPVEFKPNDDKGVLVSLNIAVDGASFSCDGFVPPKPKPQEAQTEPNTPLGKFRLPDYRTNQMSCKLPCTMPTLRQVVEGTDFSSIQIEPAFQPLVNPRLDGTAGIEERRFNVFVEQ